MNNNYPKPMIIMHWITFVLVVIVYLTSGDPTRTGLQGQIHVIGGISIFIRPLAKVVIASSSGLPVQRLS